MEKFRGKICLGTLGTILGPTQVFTLSQRKNGFYHSRLNLNMVSNILALREFEQSVLDFVIMEAFHISLN